MVKKFLCIVLFLQAMCLPVNLELDLEVSDEWEFRQSQQERVDQTCAHIRPSAKDIIRRFYAILPYFDKEHANTAFLHKFRGTVYNMAHADDVLDREAGYYAAMLTPLVFLNQQRDTWCLLERFHRSLRLYQISHPTDKRSALKLLQNLRSINVKLREFLSDLRSPGSTTSTTEAQEFDEFPFTQKKDVRYLKELIKNLG